MAKDLIPTNGNKLSNWSEKFRNSIKQHGDEVGLSPGDVATIVQLCDEMIEQRRETVQAIRHSQAMGKKEKALQKKNVNLLRKYIRTIKANGATTNQLVGVGIKTHHQKLDAETYQAKIFPVVENDFIRIKFKKYGIDRMEFWGSCNGGPFHRLESFSRSPFDFKPEPHPNHLPQRWQIKAIAIYKDKHFGSWSNIHTVLYESGIEAGIPIGGSGK